MTEDQMTELARQHLSYQISEPGVSGVFELVKAVETITTRETLDMVGEYLKPSLGIAMLMKLRAGVAIAMGLPWQDLHVVILGPSPGNETACFGASFSRNGERRAITFASTYLPQVDEMVRLISDAPAEQWFHPKLNVPNPPPIWVGPMPQET